MYRPNQIANYFIKKSLDTGNDVTPMKVLKLVYIAHGWYLGLSGDDLINEGVQAWKYGPVIPSVYHKFKIYGNEPIRSTVAFDIPSWSDNPLDKGVSMSDYQEIPNHIKVFLDKIWEVYGKYNGVQLSEMTHKAGTPWHKTWVDLGGKDKRDAIIPNNIIKEHYKKLAQGAPAEHA